MFRSPASLTAWCLAAAAVALGRAAAADETAPDSRALRVMTFNIRWANPFDCGNAWPLRRDWVAEIIRTQRPDLLGCQEVLASQRDDLTARLPEYDGLFAGRSDGQERGEGVPIFYRRDRFELVEHATFWLSETPDTPGSKGWDASLPRITTYARLRDMRTDALLSVFNTHLDHRGAMAREQSARLLRARVAAVPASDTAILMGDFNCRSSSRPYHILTADDDDLGPGRLYDSRQIAAKGHEGPETSWNGFTALVPHMQIDFILTNRRDGVRRHWIIDERKDGRFPSDHLPVLAEWRLSQ